MSYPVESSFSTATFERMKFRSNTAISRAILQDAKISQMPDITADQMLMQLEVELLGNRDGRIVYTFPATVWDMWKARHLPKFGRFGRWLLHRHPVREDAKAFSARSIFPQATVKVPPTLGPVVFHVVKESDYWMGGE